ncbi:MAG: methionyl-tRNA formyltransferase [Lachnospiraceae bacterium]|nr:methionyl-tRNA formyltransferase [Lachnospiraceae bacterium]
MRILFMGTPDFSVPALEALVKGGHEVAAVVTQPDKPKGRGKAVLMTPVKEKALEYGIPVYQPVRVKKDEEFLRMVEEMKPDAIVVIAFGQILPKRLLDIPKYGCINIHASLLPKYRGAAPIQWAVIDGEKETGITTMMMDVGLDTGDMLEKVVIPIEKDETGGSLHDKLSAAGGPLILSTLKKAEEGTLVRTPQTEEGTCYAKMLTKSLGDIDWSQDAESIERLIRGLNPWPSAYTSLNGKTLKIWQAEVLDESPEGTPGQVVKASQGEFLVKTGKGTLKIESLQLEGKKRMDTDAFLRGYAVEAGTVFERRQ